LEFTIFCINNAILYWKSCGNAHLIMDKPATIIDIAKALNISASTVSRALNNHPSISSKTKKEVHELATKLNYHPNLTARNLLRKKSGIIGVIVPEITSYFFSTVITGIQDIVSSVGYKLIISQTNESFEEERKLIHEMALMRVEGLLVSPSFNTQGYEHLEEARRSGIPVVIFDRDIPGFNSSKVFVDVYDGAYQAMKYLITSGCKNIAHIAGPEHIPTFQQRLRAYEDALRDYNRPLDPDLIVFSTGFSAEDGIETCERLLHRNFDALFCVNDAVAIGAMHVLREKGYKIPEDISVIGYDDEPYSCYFSPSLTTIWQPVYDMGLLSSRILLDSINKDHQTIRTEVLKPELVIRESSLTN
jgi:LacI family transcriptional regulator